MTQQGAGSDFFRQLAIRAGIHLGTFLAGAILAFAYSYSPLHSAKDWKIDYLEERLVTKDGELDALEARLAELETESADKPDGQTFKQVQAELNNADKTVKDLERQIANLERKTKDLEKSRNDWKSKYDKAETSRVAAVEAREKRESAAKPAPAADVPAAVAAPGTPIVSDAVVRIGTRWRSPDGRSDFDLVAISDGRARVVPDASTLRPGSVPATKDVAAGQQFSVGAPDGRTLHVFVERIDGESGIVIDVTD